MDAQTPPNPYQKDSCECCRVAAARAVESTLYEAGPLWTVNAEGGSPNRPRLVLQLRRHADDLSDLTGPEAAELGRLLPRLVGLTRDLAGAQRVYVVYLNESA